MLVEGVKEGDYVLIHAGFAMEKIDEEEARKTLELFQVIETGKSENHQE